jgi:excisionase family DNA binding protein
MPTDTQVREHTKAVMKRLLDMKEVAATLSVGRSTVFDLVGSGELPSVRIGRRRLVHEDALRDFIEALAQTA